MEIEESYTLVFLCSSLCLWTDLSGPWRWDSWMFCTSSFFCLPLETPWWWHNEKQTSYEWNMTAQENRISVVELKSMCTVIGLKSCRTANPFAIFLLHVEVVGRVNALLHASPVPGDPTLDRHISGGWTQSKLLKILHGHRRCWLKWERVRRILLYFILYAVCDKSK